MIIQGDVILIPQIYLVPMWETVYPKLSHWKHCPKCAILLHLSNIRPKMKSHCTVMGAILVVTDIPQAYVYSIIPHVNGIRLVHTHMYQVPFGLCWTWCYVLDEKSLLFEHSILIFGCLSALWSPHISLPGFLYVTNTISYCYWSSRFSWYLLPSYLEPPSLESL